MATVSERQPQSAYVGIQRSLQAEWLFLQRVTDNTDELFDSMDESMTKGFLPSLLGDASISPHRRALLTLLALPVKQCGIALPSPSSTAEHFFLTSRLCTAHAAEAIQEESTYVRRRHLKVMAEEKLRAEIQRDAVHETLKREALSSCGEFERRTIERASETGAWLQVMPTHDNGMSLSPVEWRDGCSSAMHGHHQTSPHMRWLWGPLLRRVWSNM